MIFWWVEKCAFPKAAGVSASATAGQTLTTAAIVRSLTEGSCVKLGDILGHRVQKKKGTALTGKSLSD